VESPPQFSLPSAMSFLFVCFKWIIAGLGEASEPQRPVMWRKYCCGSAKLRSLPFLVSVWVCVYE